MFDVDQRPQTALATFAEVILSTSLFKDNVVIATKPFDHLRVQMGVKQRNH